MEPSICSGSLATMVICISFRPFRPGRLRPAIITWETSNLTRAFLSSKSKQLSLDKICFEINLNSSRPATCLWASLKTVSNSLFLFSSLSFLRFKSASLFFVIASSSINPRASESRMLPRPLSLLFMCSSIRPHSCLSSSSLGSSLITSLASASGSSNQICICSHTASSITCAGNAFAGTQPLFLAP